MKPLNPSELSSFLERFDTFKDSEIRSLELLSASQMQITLTAQDSARAHDWITITFEFSGIEDAKLLPDNQLNYVDMNDGISLLYEENKFAFAIGECYNISNVKNAPLYIVASDLKYQEGQF